MAQGDIYTIDVRLKNSSQIVEIVNDSIVLNGVASLTIYTNDTQKKYGELNLLNSNGEVINRLFHKPSNDNMDEVIGLSAMKKLKLNAGDQLQFMTNNATYSTVYLSVRITLMVV